MSRRAYVPGFSTFLSRFEARKRFNWILRCFRRKISGRAVIIRIFSISETFGMKISRLLIADGYPDCAGANQAGDRGTYGVPPARVRKRFIYNVDSLVVWVAFKKHPFSPCHADNLPIRNAGLLHFYCSAFAEYTTPRSFRYSAGSPSRACAAFFPGGARCALFDLRESSLRHRKRLSVPCVASNSFHKK